MVGKCKGKTNIDSVETLLRDFREFEETKMGKLMQANQLMLQLEQLRAEKESVDEKEQTPSPKFVKAVRLDTPSQTGNDGTDVSNRFTSQSCKINESFRDEVARYCG